MRKLFYLFFLLAGLTLIPTDMSGQFSLATTNAAGNGSAGITFEVTAVRNVRIDTLYVQHFSGSGTTTADIWGRPGGMNAPPTISTAAGWTQLVSGQSIPISVGNPTPIPVALNIVLTAGSTYGFYIGSGTTVAYTTGGTNGTSAPYTYTDGNITILAGGYGGGVPNPTFFPRVYNGRVSYAILGGTNDAGVVSVDSVTAACPGNQNIWTTIGNYGANQIDSVTVNWSWNGTVQTPIQLVTLLDTFGGMGSTTAPVFLGNRNLAAGQIYTLRVWTSNPNGVADTSNYNDTLTTSVGASLQGIYTINSGAASSGSNFTSFTDAVAALNAFGVCGPVTFLVAPNSGPYKEQISIGQITGASSTNTITFNGGPTKEEIWVDAGMTNSNDRHVIRLDGADHVTLTNLTISNHSASGVGTVYGVGLHMLNEADSNVISNCIIEVDSGGVQTSGNFVGIQMAGAGFATSANPSGSYNLITGNQIHGGYYGMTMRSTNTASFEQSNTIENNEFTGQWYYNMYCYGQSGLVIRNNLMRHRDPFNTFGYGIYFAYMDTMRIEGNTIIDPLGYGMYMFNGNKGPGNTPSSGYAYIVNNSISGHFGTTLPRGIYMSSNTENIRVYHNSISITSGSSSATAAFSTTTSSTTFGMDLQNNSFAVFNTTSGHAVFTGTNNVAFMNYNNYYNDGDTSRVIYYGQTLGLAAMVGFGGQNLNSYHGDPLYLNNDDDLHSKGTQLWDRGNDTLGILVDIDGDVRPGFGGMTPDIGSDEYQPPQLDISVSAMVSPTLPICPGTFNVIINVQNFGQDTINSYTVNWSVNGTAQTPVSVTGASVLTSQGTAVNLGNLNIMGNTPYDIVFWTTSPNGGTDEDMSNDTLSFLNLRTGIAAGNYIINSALPTGGIIYNSFQDAVDDLNAYGICGSVTFIVAPSSGPYNEQITLGPVVGTSSTSTITFDGGPTKEQIWADSLTNTNDRAVIKIDGGDWITLKNLTITNYSPGNSFSYYGFGVHLQNEADHNTIDGCVIEVDTAQISTSGNFCGIAMAGTFATSSNPAGSYNTIQNNTIISGYYGITMRSASTTDFEVGNRVLNNVLTGQNYYNIYQYGQGGSIISGNDMDHRRNNSTFGYGIYTGYCDTFLIEKNRIVDPKAYGMYFFRANWQGNGQVSQYARVENNMISGWYAGGTRYGFGVSSNTKKVAFFHNSVSIPYDNGNAFRQQSTFNVDSLDIRNNSFAVFGNNGRPVFLFDSLVATDLNYNNYYSGDSTALEMSGNVYDATNYRGGGGWNIASRFGDPGYVDNWTNLHVKGNQLWNAGNNGVGVMEDIDNQVRPDSFIVDIGADEFRPPAQEVAFVTFIEPVSACGYSATSNVVVQVRNAGLEPIDSLEISYRMNNGTVSSEWVYFNPGIASGANATHTFMTTVNMTATGRYEFDAWASLPGDTCFVNDSLHDFEVWHDVAIGTFPHFEDFESGPGGWRAQGNGNWQWGLPRGTDIDTAASGVKAWMTDTATNYQNSECSWILSPCYDFSTLNLPQIKMFINFDSESSWDGTQLQASTDSGKTWVQIGDLANTNGTQVNWYNDGTISGLGTCLSLPFGQQEGWTNPSFGTTSGGWIPAEIKMPQLAGEPDVRFRFFFGSDGSVNVGYDGFAVDDIEISDVPPNDLGVVAIISPSSGACGDSNTVVTAVVRNYGSLEQQGYPISVAISDSPGVAITTLTTVTPDTIFPGQQDTILVGVFNTYAGGQFTFVGYTNLTGDLDRTNDSIVVGPVDIIPIPAPPTVNDVIFCEPDSALLSVVNPDTNFSYSWYATDTSTTALAEDTFQLQTPLLNQTTTYWVQQTSRDGGAPILITEFNLGFPDMIEIQNLSSTTVDATGWVVATSNSYTVINTANSLVWQLGAMGPGQIDFRTDQTGNNYWGNNLFYNPGSPAWAMVIDAQGNVVDAVFAEWSAADIAGFNTTINGFTITGADIPWSGPGVPTSGVTDGGIDRIGNSDNDDNTDWIGTLTRTNGTQNPQLQYPGFSAGLGCSSARVPVQVIISPITPPNLGPDNVVCGGLLLDAGAGYATYSWNNGPMTQANFVDLSGQYSVTVSDINGCTGTDTINLIINPNPIVDLGADTTVCGSILLDAGNPGATWTWSDGSISQTYLVTNSGPEFVNVVDANGCETRDTVDITVNALPALDLGLDRVECDSVLLDVNNPGLPVMWDDGSTNQTRSITASGSYYVSVTDPATTCEARDTVNLTINISPVVDLGLDGDYCDILILDAENPGALYNWSTGDLSQTIIVTNNNEGTINVEVTDINGCAGVDTITVNIVDQPVIGFNEQRQGLDTYNFTNNSTGENITYTWDFGDGSAPVNTRDASHTYAPGFYQACLTIANACDTLKQCVDVHAIGVGVEDELLANSISLYPNPTTEKINIDIAGLNDDVEVTVSDVTGRILFKDVISRFEQSSTTSYDLSEEAKGVYTVIFKMGDHRLTRRVVLK